MRSDCFHGGAGFHVAPGFGREALSGRDDPAIAHRLPQYGGRDDAGHVRRRSSLGHLLQLHNVHGGVFCGINNTHSQLPPPQR